MRKRPIGIDLGTTNSVVAASSTNGLVSVLRNREGQETTPSVIAFDEIDGIVVGEPAVMTFGFGLSPGAALFKRKMGSSEEVATYKGVSYSPIDLSALVLRKLVDDAELSLGFRPEQAVITVPAYFRNTEREATLEAARIIGLEVLQLVNEPTAAADYYRQQGDADAGCFLVYDLGGGTFDVSVLKTGQTSEVLDTRGDAFLGGADWDHALVELILTQAADQVESEVLSDPGFLRAIRREAESAKKRLSSMRKVQVSINHEGKVARADLTREEFEDATSGLVARTLDMTSEAIAGARDRSGSVIDAILLVGGSTKMPMIAAALEDRFRIKALRTVNPDLVVALGAALKAEEHMRAADGPSHVKAVSDARSSALGLLKPIKDITSFALGAIAVSEDGSAYVNREMISRGTTLPCDKIQPFSHTFRRGKDPSLELFVTQGEGRSPLTVGYLGRYTLDTLPGATEGRKCDIEIGYSYDASGIGNARARIAGQSVWAQMQRSELPPDVPQRFSKAPPKPLQVEVTILLFFDVSGSMSGPPIASARLAAEENFLNDDLSHAKLGIGVVSDNSIILQLPIADRRAVKRAIDEIDVNVRGCGGGNAGHPFDDVLKVLGKLKGERYAVVLADGVWSDQGLAIERAQACKDAGIEIVGVGFGGADEAFLGAISSSRDLTIMTSQAGLSSAFGSIAQEISERSSLKRN